MPVLKSSSSPSVAPQAFSMCDIERQAMHIVERARQQAGALLEEAGREAERVRAEAAAQGRAEGELEGRRAGEQQGREAGRREALAQARPQVAQLVESLAAAARQVEASRQELLSSAEKDVVRLAVEIARRVVRGIGASRAEVVGETVASAVKFVVGRNDVKIAINPAQQSVLADALPALQLQWPALRHVEIVADAAVAPGGARLLTGQGAVDATLDGMIDRIAADLLGDAAGSCAHHGPVGGVA